MRQESQPLASTATQTHAVVAIPAGAWRPEARQLPAAVSARLHRPARGDCEACRLWSQPTAQPGKTMALELCMAGGRRIEAELELSRLRKPVGARSSPEGGACMLRRTGFSGRIGAAGWWRLLPILRHAAQTAPP